MEVEAPIELAERREISELRKGIFLNIPFDWLRRLIFLEPGGAFIFSFRFQISVVSRTLHE